MLKIIGLIGGISWESSDLYYQILNKKVQKTKEGFIKESSKKRFLEMIVNLIAQSAEGIISGCTEIELLIKPSEIKVTLFETTRLHAKKAVRLALKE